MDGYELCQFVKNTPGYEQIKVVFLSAKSREADVQKGYDAGADLYLPKLFSTRELVDKVRKLMSQQTECKMSVF